MAHTIRDKTRLLNRVHRLRGQLDAVEKALEEERDSYTILQTIASCHGAMKGLMVDLIQGHIRFHVADPDERPTSQRAKAAQQLIEIVHSYMR
jgi:DNA-binding FrmR family transcriptional regulator